MSETSEFVISQEDVPAIRFAEPDEDYNFICVTFHSDGRIEFGEKYRDNPDAAAQEFMRIVCEQFPGFVAKVAGH